MMIKQCPVCEMQVNAMQYVNQHHGIDYCFCSKQCQQTFLARPRLYLKPVKKVLLKTRAFHLQNNLPEVQEKEVCQKLMRLMGVRSVKLKNKRVIVTYNLLETCARYIVQALEDLSLQLRASWLDQWKWSWVNDMEENALNNLAEPDGACCNKPPAKG